jgi:hypothetical protein
MKDLCSRRYPDSFKKSHKSHDSQGLLVVCTFDLNKALSSYVVLSPKYWKIDHNDCGMDGCIIPHRRSIVAATDDIGGGGGIIKNKDLGSESHNQN